MAEMMKKFGKFFLLDQLAQGGMAEIYRARMATPDGGGRLLAIKRIIQSYSSNAEFVTMFKSEIKTTSGFTHPNIVQLYDYGEEQQMLYIAMEYVDGRNLRQFISRFSELKTQFPIEAAVYIMEQAAHGMAYAHGYKDKFSGKNLNIVHRDISPQNILISYDGAVKVIDFGIAKAVTNAEATRAGVIKGKPSYLSPEQISGEALDGRSDIFALGICLWELLAGRKLFAGDNDFSVLKLIENCTNHVKPPSMYNPKVTKELDAIVLKCLQKNRDQRFSTAEEMQRALHKFLYQYAPDFNPADLAYYARDLFKNEIVEDRKKLLKLNEKAEQLLVTMEQEASKAAPAPKPALKPTLAAAADSVDDEETTLAAGGSNANDKTQATETLVPKKQPAATQKPGAQPKEKNTGSFRMVDFDKGQLASQKPKEDVKLDYAGTKTATAATRSQPGTPGNPFASASPLTKSKVVQKGRPSSTSTGITYSDSGSNQSSRVAALLLILGLAGGYWYYTNEMQGGPGPASVAATATLAINGNVKAATVMVDERQVATQLPAVIPALPSDKPLHVTVSSNGYKKFSQEVTIGNGETKQVTANLEREGDAATGVGHTGTGTTAATSAPRNVTLQISVTPAGLGTSIKVNGRLLDPSGVTTVSTDTNYDLVVERDGFRKHRGTIMIESAKIGTATNTVYSVQLEAAKFGYVSIKTVPNAEAHITIDGVDEKWAIPISRRRIPVGTYKVRLVNAVLGMEKQVTFTVNEDRFVNIEERLSVADESGRVPSSK